MENLINKIFEHPYKTTMIIAALGTAISKVIKASNKKK